MYLGHLVNITKVIPACLPDNSNFGGFGASEAAGKLSWRSFCITNHYQNCELNSDCKIFITVMLQQSKMNTAGFSDDRWNLQFLAEDNSILQL